MAVGLSENDLMNDLFEQKKKIPDVWLIPKKELEGIQNDILNNQTYNFIVTGSAGSGKTVLATYKFMELVALYGCDEVTLVVYTLSLMEFIKCGLENTIKTYKDETFKNVNIDKLNIFNAGNKKLSDKISEGSFNYILIDETQDMTEEFIKNISLNIKNFMFFGDDEQTLYKNRISMERLKSIINKKIKLYSIDKHYRVPKSVMEFAQCIIERADLTDNCNNEEIEYKPKVVNFSKTKDEFRYVIETIKGLKLKNVGIFVNRRESIIKAIEVFEECGLKEKYKYKLDDDIETLNFNDIDKPTILTYHSSKGLQFDHVFVTCCDNNKIYATKDNDELNYRNSLFVACTRTKGRLYVTYCGTLNEFMININSSLYTGKDD